MGNPLQFVMLILEVIKNFLSCCIGIGPRDWSSLAGLLSGSHDCCGGSSTMAIIMISDGGVVWPPISFCMTMIRSTETIKVLTKATSYLITN